jgi:hypothetical protein
MGRLQHVGQPSLLAKATAGNGLEVLEDRLQRAPDTWIAVFSHLTLLTWPGSAIVHDIKGDNWQLTDQSHQAADRPDPQSGRPAADQAEAGAGGSC